MATVVIHRTFAPTILIRCETRAQAYKVSQQLFHCVSGTPGLSEKYAVESELPEVGVGSNAEFTFILLAGHGEPAARYGIESKYVVKKLPAKSTPLDYLHCLQV